METTIKGLELRGLRLEVLGARPPLTSAFKFQGLGVVGVRL